jgi:hypothetical protein
MIDLSFLDFKFHSGCSMKIPLELAVLGILIVEIFLNISYLILPYSINFEHEI